MRTATCYLSGPNAEYHKAMRDYCAALVVLHEAASKVRKLSEGSGRYTTSRELARSMDADRAVDLGGLDDAWTATVECSAAVESLVFHWLIPHIDGLLYRSINGYLDDVMAEESERVQHRCPQMNKRRRRRNSVNRRHEVEEVR